MRYHVLIGEGRRLGPYDRRTIVGMRMKKALSSKSLLESTEGAQLTVGELVRGRAPDAPPADLVGDESTPSGSGSYSVIQAVQQADLLEVEGTGYTIPPFKGEVEVRVQTKVLRVAGRFRDGRVWKEERVKFPLQDIVHARLQGSVVELGVRPPDGEGLQRLRLDLRSAESAGELAERLPHTVPWPGSEPLAGRAHKVDPAIPVWLWGLLAFSVMAVGGAFVWLLSVRL
jgi:hypothetical protein